MNPLHAECPAQARLDQELLFCSTPLTAQGLSGAWLGWRLTTLCCCSASAPAALCLPLWLLRRLQCWAFSACVALITTVTTFMRRCHEAAPADWDVPELLHHGGPSSAVAQAALRQLTAAGDDRWECVGCHTSREPQPCTVVLVISCNWLEGRFKVCVVWGRLVEAAWTAWWKLG